MIHKNSAVAIFIEIEKQEKALKKPYNSQRMTFLIKRKMNIKQRRKLIQQGASRKQINRNTKHLDRKERRCYPRGKAWERVVDNVYNDMVKALHDDL